MDIKNTISYDSNYIKSSKTEANIKQDIPVINNSKINLSVERINKIDSLDKKEKIEDVIESIYKSNKKLETFDRKLEISVHEKTKEVMVKVIDTSTDEIIRELPPEKVLDSLAFRKEIIGMLMDKKI